MKEANDLLFSVMSSIRVGGRETLYEPPVFSCSDQTHEPFRLMEEAFQSPESHERYLWGVVSTNGAQFDGDRTDIHDVFSLVWAAVLRAFGLSSPWLIDEPHGFVPGELGARHLVLQQCPWSISEDDIKIARDSMNAWSAFAFHMLDDVFKWGRIANSARPDVATTRESSQPAWSDALSKYLRNPKDFRILRRNYPLWLYVASHTRGATIIKMPWVRVKFLKVLLTPFSPMVTEGSDAYLVRANGIPNAVPYRLIKKAKKILSITGDSCPDLLVLPIDSHCLFIGGRTIIALRENCGKELFQKERELLLSRRRTEDKVIYADAKLAWETPLNAGEFEDLCLDLIEREPGVIRAKPVGTVNDRDAGRDILIDLKVPSYHNISPTNTDRNKKGFNSPGGATVIRVIAQVKSRSKTIGKRDVQDIRDTLEHYEADGFFLIAHPRISTALVDHLEELRKKTSFRTDWWEARDLENRLRRHPDIASRYPRLVSFSDEPHV